MTVILSDSLEHPLESLCDTLAAFSVLDGVRRKVGEKLIGTSMYGLE